MEKKGNGGFRREKEVVMDKRSEGAKKFHQNDNT